MFVEAFVAKTTIEALDIAVLGRFTGLYEIEFYSVVLGPELQGTADKFGTVVADDTLRCPTLLEHRVQNSYNQLSGNRPLNLNRKAFAREIINEVERTEPATIRKLVRDEVH